MPHFTTLDGLGHHNYVGHAPSTNRGDTTPSTAVGGSDLVAVNIQRGQIVGPFSSLYPSRN